jgi:DNA-binding NtrC family response regulator
MCTILIDVNVTAEPRLVAIVDDEEDIVRLFSDALNRTSNATIFTFTDPVLALEHFTSNKDRYAMVISDFRMPGLNGLELIKKMKSMNPKVRTLLMTAFDGNEDLFKEYTDQEMINVFIRKPIRIDDLRNEVSNQLHTYEIHKHKLTPKI